MIEEIDNSAGLEQVIRQAVEFLKVTKHRYNCSYLHPIEHGKIAKPCDCGLDEVITALCPWAERMKNP